MEIDKGSFTSAGLNQLQELINEKYRFFDIESKYAAKSRLGFFPLSKGKSNAYLAKQNFAHEKLYFHSGMKRLIYKIIIHQNLTLFFAHFSLNKSMRAKQILKTRDLMQETSGEVIFMGDFNILSGLGEISPLLDHGRFVLLNQEDAITFTFHKRKLVLDLCICSAGLVHQAHLKIIPQPYSDHAALMLTVHSD
jgi:endonuclease/exonuclease/phosphatase family metal-dependent hydrolase